MNDPKPRKGRPRLAPVAAHDARRLARICERARHDLYDLADGLARCPEATNVLMAEIPLYLTQYLTNEVAVRGALREFQRVLNSRGAAGEPCRDA